MEQKLISGLKHVTCTHNFNFGFAIPHPLIGLFILIPFLNLVHYLQQLNVTAGFWQKKSMGVACFNPLMSFCLEFIMPPSSTEE